MRNPEQAEQPLGYVSPDQVRRLQRGESDCIALVARSEADLSEGGDVPVFLRPRSAQDTQSEPGSDSLRIDWCIRTLEQIKTVGRDHALGDQWPDLVAVIGALKTVARAPDQEDTMGVIGADGVKHHLFRTHAEEMVAVALSPLKVAQDLIALADRVGAMLRPPACCADASPPDGWSNEQPNADGRWLWREGGREGREVALLLCGDGHEVADAGDDAPEGSPQAYWMRTPTDQRNMPGLWRRAE